MHTKAKKVSKAKKVYIPNPGSALAIKKGCICPVMDNHHGAGCGEAKDGSRIFYRNDGCLVHGKWAKP